MTPVTIDWLSHCSRCGRDHANLRFVPFINPVIDADGSVDTHWASCPTNGDPILLRKTEESES